MKMLLSVVVLSAILSCYGQEHLTCLRSTSTPAGPSDTLGDASGGRVQAVPGKKGPMGEKGESGAKGEKGEAGVAYNSLVEQLRDEISSLQQKLEESTRSFSASAFRSGFVRLDDGWVGLFNGLQYKYIRTLRNHSASKDICRDMGATLAYRGIQDMGNRKILNQALSFSPDVWIGLTEGRDGDWRWENGHPAIDATILWLPSQPSNRSDNNCGGMLYHFDLLSFDARCTSIRAPLCEKVWNS